MGREAVAVGAELGRPSRLARGPSGPNNRAGLRRARRLLGLYLGLLLVVYLGVVALMASSPYEGVRDDLPVYLLLGVIAAVSAIAGYFLTVGRAPWAVYVAEGSLVVRERFGNVRRYPIDGSLRIRFVARNDASLLSPEATETVRLSAYEMKTREYVLADGFLAGVPELADALGAR